MMTLYLQNIVEDFSIDSLPAQWVSLDLEKFSDKKRLFRYQQEALENALKALYKFYIDCKGSKEEMFRLYEYNGLKEDLYLELDKKISQIYEEFQFKVEKGKNKDKLSFSQLTNRMSFWMATGSGKTLIIVKLIELLWKLIKSEEIPKKDILFLTYREDLIDQFRRHVDEFNSSSLDVKIELHSLKDYERVKRNPHIPFGNTVEVFYYRSDLISNEQKDKILNFRNYDNYGNWFILLDEAHKGDKEDSKRQHYYTILSRNGFLFNFSATFTEEIDFATCVYKYNLEEFVKNGYGKHIYIAQSDVSQLGEKKDYNEEEKQKIVLKVLLLLTYISMQKFKVKNYYHKPLMLTLVNSVDTKDSDLEIFFKELVKVASNELKENIIEQAKQELIEDLKKGKLQFEEEENLHYNEKEIQNLTYEDILWHVFNAKSPGKIEVLKIPGNKQELVLKLTTTERPFGLIKIGDISEWIKNKLSGYQIIEKFENESVFSNINKDDSDINILMGSRAFYEGWDSNRPNIILYINIGKGKDARKFVLQSLGRGVRIEPLPNQRRRMKELLNEGKISKEEFKKVKDYIFPLETLFVYGTKVENLEEIMEALKEEKHEEYVIGSEFKINPEVEGKLLLIPTYKESDKILAEEKDSLLKFEISNQDFELTKNYLEYIGDKIAIVKYDCQPKILKTIKESFENANSYYRTVEKTIKKPDVIVRQLIQHFEVRLQEVNGFKHLENEIVHFKRISVTQIDVEELSKRIKKVLSYTEKDKEKEKIKKLIQEDPQNVEKYIEELIQIGQKYKEEDVYKYNSVSIKIRYILNHYYIPVLISEDQKENYIKHIIKTESEREFLENLIEYLNSKKEDNFFNQFDWWMFSKIDETLDDVYIPYYNPMTNKIAKFKPDFIFWFFKKDKDTNYTYTILFVDPKGTEYTDAERKIDGFVRLFNRTYYYDGFPVKVYLRFYTKDKAKATQNYRKFWFDKIDELKDIF